MRGFFLDDVIWGPAEYEFAPLPGSSSSDASGSQGTGPEADGRPQRRRLRYAGMMNGRPQGKGCMSWSDGTQEMGQVRGWQAGCYACRQPALQRPTAQPDSSVWSTRYHRSMPDMLVCPPQFDGTNCYLRLSQEEVAGVLLVAADNASEARIAAAEVQHNAVRQHRPIAEAAAQLFAMMLPPSARDTHADTA